MKLNFKFASLMITGLMTLALTASAAEEAKKEAPVMTAEQAKMMENWKAASEVTPNHKALDYLVGGEWKTTTKMWQDPKAKAEVSTGTTRFESILGGRFVREQMDGSAMGMPFQGLGYFGYDNMKKKYVTLWMDNMSTSVFMMEGESKDNGKTITSSGEFLCPMTGQPKYTRSVMKKMSKDMVRYEHFEKDAAGKEFKSLEVVYKR